MTHLTLPPHWPILPTSSIWKAGPISQRTLTDISSFEVQHSPGLGWAALFLIKKQKFREGKAHSKKEAHWRPMSTASGLAYCNTTSILSCIMLTKIVTFSQKEPTPWQVLQHLFRVCWKSRCNVLILGGEDTSLGWSCHRRGFGSRFGLQMGRGSDQGAMLQAGIKHQNQKENSCSPFTLPF